MTTTIASPPKLEKLAKLGQGELIAARLPEKTGSVRKIHFLWDNHWRVNFHNPNQGNFIIESYFVSFDENSEIKISKETLNSKKIEAPPVSTGGDPSRSFSLLR